MPADAGIASRLFSAALGPARLHSALVFEFGMSVEFKIGRWRFKLWHVLLVAVALGLLLAFITPFWPKPYSLF